MKAKKLSIFVILLLCSILSFSQKDYSQKFKKEIVKIETGKFTIENFMLMQLSNDKTVQVKLSATCPIEVMSRDNFISLFKTWSTDMLHNFFSDEDMKLTKLNELDELIGEPDIKLHFVMTKNGLQVQTEIFGEKGNHTGTWQEVLEN